MPPTVYDFFTFYLEAAHLQGQARTVTIAAAEAAQVFNPRTNHNDPALVVKFRNANRALKLNKTQAEALMTIAGEDYTKWTGTVVILSPAKSRNGKDTILISPVESEKPKP